MQQSKNDVWVGLFVMLGVVALVFLALQSANLLTLNFQSGYRVTARFDNIGGLKPQAAVRSAGVVVGRVESITFDDKIYQARVTLQLQDRMLSRKTVRSKFSPVACWGEQYMASRPVRTSTIWHRGMSWPPRSPPSCWKTLSASSSSTKPPKACPQQTAANDYRHDRGRSRPEEPTATLPGAARTAALLLGARWCWRAAPVARRPIPMIRWSPTTAA